MSLVYAGICSHGPGITARADPTLLFEMLFMLI